MLFMGVGTWPSKSSVDVGKTLVKLLEKPILPSYVKALGRYITYGGDGVKAYVLWEVEKGKEDEGYKALMNQYAQFLNIEGYKVTLEPLLKAEEALPLIGL